MMRVARGSRARTSGFTLAELLTVVVILGIVSGIALPVFNTQRQRSYLAVARADAAAVAKALPAALMDINTVGANGVTMTLNQAGETLTLTNTGSGTPVTVTLSARLSSGSSLDASNQANNLVRSLTSYCIAIVNNGQTAYQAPEGSATGCTLGSQTAVGGSGTVGTGNGVSLQPIYKTGTLPSQTWQGIGYGNGVFMVVSSSTASVYTSTNGTSWTVAGNLPSVQTYRKPAYGNGRWVVVAGTNSYYSTNNGATWTAGGTLPLAVSGTYSGTGAFWTGSRFIVTSLTGTAGGSIATSADGVSWALSGPASITSYRLAVNAAGTVMLTALSGTTAYVSTDGGATWSSVTFPGGSISSVGSRWVANDNSGINSAFYYSDDNGATWTKGSGTYTYLGTLATSGAQVVGFSGYMGKSDSTYTTDGVTWRSTSTGCSVGYSDTAFGNGIFVSIPNNFSGYSTCVAYEY